MTIYIKVEGRDDLVSHVELVVSLEHILEGISVYCRGDLFSKSEPFRVIFVEFEIHDCFKLWVIIHTD